MIIHIVMWTLKEFAECAGKSENAEILKRKLEALKDMIPEINHLEVGFNMNESPSAFEVVLYSEFIDKEGLAAYQIHPEHRKVAEFVGAITERRGVADYER